MPGPLRAAALTSGIALGFTQVVLATAVPALTVGAGGTPEQAALVLSAFGMGGAAGCLLVRRHGITPLTGGSLGLPPAALGLVMLHIVLTRSAYPVTCGCLVVALIGFGTMLALAPQMSRFLAAIPRTHLGVNAALLPGAILLGTAAAQAFPSTSAMNSAAMPGDARELLWIGIAVVAAAALILGRPAVALAVSTATALQFVLTESGADKSKGVFVALAAGAVAGAVAWSRREQSDRLAQTSQAASALQHAVLRPVPERLGRLRLASLYRPATAGTEIGGDFLEALDTPFGTRILIGDVRGKGLQAVRTVTDLLGCFRSQAYETPELGELTARLDRQVIRAASACEDEELFATALLIEHDGPANKLHIVNRGHLAPLAVTPARVRQIDIPACLPLGFGTLNATEAPRPHTVALDHGTTLVAHTDGLSEARNSTGEFYPLTDQLADAHDTKPEQLVRHLDASVGDWTHHLTDDIAIVALTPATSR